MNNDTSNENLDPNVNAGAFSAVNATIDGNFLVIDANIPSGVSAHLSGGEPLSSQEQLQQSASSQLPGGQPATGQSTPGVAGGGSASTLATPNVYGLPPTLGLNQQHGRPALQGHVNGAQLPRGLLGGATVPGTNSAIGAATLPGGVFPNPVNNMAPVSINVTNGDIFFLEEKHMDRASFDKWLLCLRSNNVQYLFYNWISEICLSVLDAMFTSYLDELSNNDKKTYRSIKDLTCEQFELAFRKVCLDEGTDLTHQLYNYLDIVKREFIMPDTNKPFVIHATLKSRVHFLTRLAHVQRDLGNADEETVKLATKVTPLVTTSLVSIGQGATQYTTMLV